MLGRCIPALQARHSRDADDAGGADGDAGLHRGLVPDVQEAHLPHVAVAVTHPHLVRVLRAAVAGGGAGELGGGGRELYRGITNT